LKDVTNDIHWPCRTLINRSFGFTGR
jgi:hypothetical protein